MAGLLASAFAVLAFAFFLGFAMRVERRSDASAPYLREPPTDLPPALVGYLVRYGRVAPDDLLATILDLARRGYLRIEETGPREPGVLGKVEVGHRLTIVRDGGDELEPFERAALGFLAGAGGHRGVGDLELRAWAHECPGEVSAHLQTFEHAVRERAGELALIEPRTGLLLTNMTLGGLVAGGGAFAILAEASADASLWGAVSGAPWGAVALTLGAAQFALTPLLRRRTARGAAEQAAWRAFANYLRDFSRMEEYRPAAVAVWERYLVYAIPLGVAREASRAMRVPVPGLLDGIPWGEIFLQQLEAGAPRRPLGLFGSLARGRQP